MTAPATGRTGTRPLPVPPTTTLTPFADPLRIPPVIRPVPARPDGQMKGDGEAGGEFAEVTVTMQATVMRLHSQLPPTPVWAYDGQFPGPTFDVRSGHKLRVAWTNAIPPGPYPVIDVRVPTGTETDTPGSQGFPATATVEALPAWTAVHLHGAVTYGGNDGYPESAVLNGSSQLAEYHNDQPAAALWYHDDAMNITHLNVMAGLAGLYLIRDGIEDSLHLPGGAQEVPLIICDRNFSTDAEGNLTGELMHKVAVTENKPPLTDVAAPFAGPFTLVNGTIWPYLQVEPRWYRFRVLNASNARFYQLTAKQLAPDGSATPVTSGVYLIGEDQGLLGAPVPIPADGITLGTAERADILIDLSRFAGQTLRLYNSGTVPGAQPAPHAPYGDANGGYVMEFRVGTQPVNDDFTLPATLSPTFKRLSLATLPKCTERWIALTPPDAGKGLTVQMWELKELTSTSGITFPTDGIIQVVTPDGVTRTFQRIAFAFEDGLNFRPGLDGWEVWHFLNTCVAPAAPTAADPETGPNPGGPTHPMHIQLISFQALSKDTYTMGTATDPDLVPVQLPDGSFGQGTARPIQFRGARTLDPFEQGWKDVVRVDPYTMVTVAAQFRGATGRFVYHSHILEYEDNGMMRPFLVLPAQIAALDS